MPRVNGVMQLPPGSYGAPNTTIKSAPYNAVLDDFVNDANNARPITAGGTGAVSAADARTALGLGIGVNVQAYDALLQSIAGLTTVADRMIYTTGVDTAAVTTITSYGRSLIDDADAAAARTTLGLVIGTNVQAFDADLTAFAAVTIAANQIAYGTGAATWGVTTLSAYGRSLIDDADAATARTTLGLTIGTNVQAYDAGLAAIAALAATNGNFIVGNGTTWVAESGATALLSLGAAPLASPAFTGTPTAPTQAAGNNTTRLATTAFVTAALSAAPMVGVGQTLQSFNRLANTAYQNSTTSPIVLMGYAGSGSTIIVQMSPDNSTYTTIYDHSGSASRAMVTAIIPAGWYYKSTATFAANVVELR